MSSALKPALPASGAQTSPSKAGPGGAAASQPTGARPPALVGQNLTHHQPSAAHAAQSLAHIPMSPVSQNMAQMAQNMSHHGNLSHVGQNNVAPALGTSNGTPQPSKPAASAPLSLVQDRAPAGASQPLALTRPNDKKDETEATSTQPNGTVDSSGLPAAPVDPPTLQEADKAKSEASACPAKSPAKPVEGGAGKPTESGPSKTVEKSPAKPSEKVPAKPSEKVPAKPSEKVPAVVQVKPDSSTPSPDNQLQVNKLGSSTDVANKTSPAKPKEGKEPTHSASINPATSESSSEPKLPVESVCAKITNTPEPTITQNATKPDSATVDAEVKNSPKADPADKEEVIAEAEKPAETKPGKQETPTDKDPVAKSEDQKSPVKKEEQKSPPKKEEPKKDAAKAPEATPPPKKPELKTPVTKSTLKLATVTPTARKRRQESKSPAKVLEGPSPAKKLAAEGDNSSTPDSRISKRNRTKVQPYQSPTPELAMATKLSASAGRSTPPKPNDDKLIVFYKNEYLAVRNAEGGFYVCQTMQNVYRSSRKIKIRWLSQDKTLDPSGETYKPDFYDVTDMECVLTTLSMTRASAGGGAQILSAAEGARARSILDRALTAEQSGKPNLQLTEEHPDGLDLSLYTDESQLEKKKKTSRKRNSSKSSPEKSSDADASQKEDEATPTPSKRAKPTPKKSPKSARKETKSTTPKPSNNNNKRKSTSGSTPNVANKTALVPAKASPPAKSPAKKAKPAPAPTPPAKKTPAKPAKAEPPAKVTPSAKATPTPTKATPPPAKSKTPRKSDKESKIALLAATPSTSTGKATRTPRKPPSKKRRSSANNFILR